MEQMEYPNFNQSSVGPMVSVNLNQGKTNSNLDNKEFLMWRFDTKSTIQKNNNNNKDTRSS